MSNLEKQEKIESPEESKSLKVYKTRWIILVIFCLYSGCNAMAWIQYSIIADIISDYYDVSTNAVDWTSLIYMILYVPFIFPASYLLEKLGLRMSVILGMMGTCLGGWIKVGSVDPTRFWVGFLGQTLSALAQVFVLSVPARLAAVWFGPSQVSLACSIGVFGNQLGVALGFLIPPMIVNGKGSRDEITKNLYTLFISFAVLTTVILVLIIIFFKKEPPSPPSNAQVQQCNEEPISFFRSLKNLLTNRSYVLLLIAYGINVGVFYALSTLLNQIVLEFYPNGGKDAGQIGLVIVVSGMVGSVVCGFVLDKFHRYKETTLLVYILTLIGMIGFTFTVSKGITAVYIVSSFLGFFMTGLLPVGFELAAEMTYPEPEGTSSGLLNALSNAFGVIFTNIYKVITDNADSTWANSFLAIALLFGTILTALIKSELRRQAAQTGKS